MLGQPYGYNGVQQRRVPYFCTKSYDNASRADGVPGWKASVGVDLCNMYVGSV